MKHDALLSPPMAADEGRPRPQRRSANTKKNRGVEPAPLSGPERERLRAALHDGLGQLLTSISFLATSLRQKLTTQSLPEAAEAEQIVSLTGRAISETQALVHGEVREAAVESPHVTR